MNPGTKKLGVCELNFLRRIILYAPTVYLDELQELLSTTYNVTVSLSTICRALYHDLHLTRKRITTFNIRKSLALQRMYWDILKRLNAKPHQLVFVDETAKDIRDTARLYGRSACGTRCFSPYPGRRDRYSACCALSLNGFIGWGITQGTYDSQAFRTVILNAVLPKMNPWPGEKSILIMDGAVIHKDEYLLQQIADRGMLVVFLPPYSPEFNPIELSFSYMKMYVKRHVDDWNRNPLHTLDTAIQQVLNKTNTDLFSHCGYKSTGVQEWYQPIEHYFDGEDVM